jgi:hypothetical protein
MGFRFVEDERLLDECLNFGKIQHEREVSVPLVHRVLTETPQDTKIRYVPSYLLADGQKPDGEEITWHINKSMPASLKIS